MNITERISGVKNLQTISLEVVSSIFNLFKTGMSEYEIAELIKDAFAKRGVYDFWYDVPLIVLIGTERFLDGANADYATKSPSQEYTLQDGSTIYIDVHPQDAHTSLWGDWNTMAVFHPRAGIDDEQVAFLEQMRQIHREGIIKLKPTMTGAEVASYFVATYKKNGITPLMAANSDVGHTLHEGLKGNAKRLMLNMENSIQIGGYIYAIEPAGYRQKKSGEGVLIGRFEECAYIPTEGDVVLLGKPELLSVVI